MFAAVGERFEEAFVYIYIHGKNNKNGKRDGKRVVESTTVSLRDTKELGGFWMAQKEWLLSPSKAVVGAD